MLEVVGIHGAVLDHGVGYNIVIVDLNVQRNVLGSQDGLGDLQNFGVGRGGSGNGDGGAVQCSVVNGGIIAVGGVGNGADHGAGILLDDEVSHLLALQSSLQSQDLGQVLIAFLDAEDVAVGGGGALDGQSILQGIEAGVDGVVGVDDGVVHILPHIGQLCGLSLYDLHIVGIFHDVILGGGDAGAVLELDNALLLQQQQSTGLVGGVVGNGDLNDSGILLAAAGEGQGQGQDQSQNQSSELICLFHNDTLLCDQLYFL